VRPIEPTGAITGFTTSRSKTRTSVIGASFNSISTLLPHKFKNGIAVDASLLLDNGNIRVTS